MPSKDKKDKEIKIRTFTAVAASVTATVPVIVHRDFTQRV